MSNENPLLDHNPEDGDLGTPLKIVSFCIPIVGAVLYFVNKDKAPTKAKQACNMAIYGFVLSIILQIVFTVIGGGMSALGG